MNMSRLMYMGRLWLAVLFSCAWGASAGAQSGFAGVPKSPSVACCTFGIGTNTAAQADLVQILAPDARYPFIGSSGEIYALRLSDFASQQDLVTTRAQLGSALGTTLDQLNATAMQIRSMIAHDRSRAAEGIALSAAMTIVPPNQGDRFSLTFAGAGYDGQGGGSVTGTYRVADRVMVFGGYARGQRQNLVKAGVSFSFN